MDQLVDLVKSFFLRVEEAIAVNNPEGIGALYAEAFLFAGPSGVRAGKKEEFLAVLPRRGDYFKSMGLTESRLGTVTAQTLDSRYVQAKVQWNMTLTSASGSRYLEIHATYILIREDGEALSIVCQIDHQDLASVVQAALAG